MKTLLLLYLGAAITCYASIYEMPPDTAISIINSINAQEEDAYERLAEYCTSRDYEKYLFYSNFDLVESEHIQDTARVLLESGYGDAILDGLDMLEKRGTKKDTKLVKPWLRSSDYDITSAACETYISLDKKGAYKEIKKCLSNAEPDIALVLIRKMSKIDPRKASKDIEKYLIDKVEEKGWDDEEYEQVYRSSISYLAEKKYTDTLLDALISETKGITGSATGSLCKINEPDTLVPIIDIYGNEYNPNGYAGVFFWNGFNEKAARYTASKLRKSGSNENKIMNMLKYLAPPDKMANIIYLAETSSKNKDEILASIYEQAIRKPFVPNDFIKNLPEIEELNSVYFVLDINKPKYPEYTDLMKYYSTSDDYYLAKNAALAVLSFNGSDELPWIWELVKDWSNRTSSNNQITVWQRGAYQLYRSMLNKGDKSVPYAKEALRLEDNKLIIATIKSVVYNDQNYDDEISALFPNSDSGINEAIFGYYSRNNRMTPGLLNTFLEMQDDRIRHRAFLLYMEDNSYNEDKLLPYIHDEYEPIRLGALTRIVRDNFDSVKTELDTCLAGTTKSTIREESVWNMIIFHSPDKYNDEYISYLSSEDILLKSFAVRYATERRLITEDLQAIYLSALDENLPYNLTEYIFENWNIVMGNERITQLTRFLDEYYIVGTLCSSPKILVWSSIYEIAEDINSDEITRAKAVIILGRIADHSNIEQLEALRPVSGKTEIALVEAVKKARWRGGVEIPE